MKFLALSFLVLTNLAWAQGPNENETVVRVVGTHSVTDEFEVTQESFVSNMDGYACAWPGIKGSDYIFDYHANLRHGRTHFDNNGLRVEMEAREFCGWPSGEEVFGPEFVLGAKFQLKYTIQREIVERKVEALVIKSLRETVSTELLGRKLKSVAHSFIGARGTLEVTGSSKVGEKEAKADAVQSASNSCGGDVEQISDWTVVENNTPWIPRIEATASFKCVEY